MIRGTGNNSWFGGTAALLLVACVLAGCETAPLELADDSAVPPPQLSVIHVARHSAPPKAPRLLKTAIQVRRLRAPAVQRNAPPVTPRPRELPNTGQPEAAEPFDVQTAAAKAPLDSAQFEWPVDGKVLLAFGPRSKGERNDGINIEAEPGTPIHAAAAGEVTYAGKLKGYGKLILLRHDNGYITAYAHAQAIIVSAGDRVDRGEVIGLSGKSGDVDRPQLHFEIRRGIKPLDPRPLLLSARES